MSGGYMLVKGCWGWSCQTRGPEEVLRGDMHDEKGWQLTWQKRMQRTEEMEKTPEKKSYLKCVCLILPSNNQFQTVQKIHNTEFPLNICNTSKSCWFSWFRSICLADLMLSELRYVSVFHLWKHFNCFVRVLSPTYRYVCSISTEATSTHQSWT